MNVRRDGSENYRSENNADSLGNGSPESKIRTTKTDASSKRRAPAELRPKNCSPPVKYRP
nr:hypothetical protein Itr_chr01CG23510 [Ipomoea trifida]